ncbi:MAG: hypothetical protein WC648_01320 [Candidatus Paceibacterota bacterium]|jgi:hypothetical protein
MKQNNHGLNIELERQQQSETDWRFGGFSQPCIAVIPEELRFDYLPVGEVQRGIEDMMDCASRAPINISETKFNWLYRNNKISNENKKWLEDNGYVQEGSVTFSDAFIAILSGTTRQGNSLKAPLQAIENNGLIPKSKLPYNSEMTWAEYHDPNRITQSMKDLGKEFKRRFPMNYEVVEEIHYSELYEGDLLVQAGFAWSEPIDGIYPSTDNAPNHVWVGISRPLHTIFDNYIDTVDSDFIKRLAPDYDMFEYGYRIFFSEVVKPKLTFWQWLLLKIKNQILMFKYFQ